MTSVIAYIHSSIILCLQQLQRYMLYPYNLKLMPPSQRRIGHNGATLMVDSPPLGVGFIDPFLSHYNNVSVSKLSFTDQLLGPHKDDGFDYMSYLFGLALATLLGLFVLKLVISKWSQKRDYIAIDSVPIAEQIVNEDDVELDRRFESMIQASTFSDIVEQTIGDTINQSLSPQQTTISGTGEFENYNVDGGEFARDILDISSFGDLLSQQKGRAYASNGIDAEDIQIGQPTKVATTTSVSSSGTMPSNCNESNLPQQDDQEEPITPEFESHLAPNNLKNADGYNGVHFTSFNHNFNHNLDLDLVLYPSNESFTLFQSWNPRPLLVNSASPSLSSSSSFISRPNSVSRSPYCGSATAGGFGGHDYNHGKVKSFKFGYDITGYTPSARLANLHRSLSSSSPLNRNDQEGHRDEDGDTKWVDVVDSIIEKGKEEEAGGNKHQTVKTDHLGEENLSYEALVFDDDGNVEQRKRFLPKFKPPIYAEY
ncbi:hypothetical protein CANMA_003854 [Candida margitis]|uniref:uncharacterized protein n=1 Tax=Candida margitis TaxID=1775924 RepID=UPI002227ACC7|nr:uncharacterized protein CANMA_003854 [Candida margitis]KAI5961080.1 hypothetical protein CANMA_003854 [Candida margitis]